MLFAEKAVMLYEGLPVNQLFAFCFSHGVAACCNPPPELHCKNHVLKPCCSAGETINGEVAALPFYCARNTHRTFSMRMVKHKTLATSKVMNPAEQLELNLMAVC